MLPPYKSGIEETRHLSPTFFILRPSSSTQNLARPRFCPGLATKVSRAENDAREMLEKYWWKEMPAVILRLF